MNIVLFEPEIPYNTGNIGRSCVLTNTKLHLIKPLGFSIDEKEVRRAGLDYWHLVDLTVWESFEDFVKANPNGNFYFATTKCKNRYSDVKYEENGTLDSCDKNLPIDRQILSALKLNRIGIYPEYENIEDEEYYAIWDYILDDEISDQILVIVTDKNGEIVDITWES